MKAAAAGGLWGLKAATLAKASWAVPLVFVTALLASRAVQTSTMESDCLNDLSAVNQQFGVLKTQIKDGSLFESLTAASFRVSVKPGNEDVLRMSPKAMALQIEQLREIVAKYNGDNRRLAMEKRQLAEEKAVAVDQLARRAAASSQEASSAASAAKCESALAAVKVSLASVRDELDTARAEHLTTKASLDEAKDQVKQSDTALETLKTALQEAEAKFEKSQNRVRRCRKLARLAARQTAAAAAAVGADGGDRAYQQYPCDATEEDMKRYLDYQPRMSCPNDWYFVQRLIFKKNCFSLPRRRCRAVTPRNPTDPLPFPQSLFDQNALKDRNVRWDLHQCKGFECLNSRVVGDCRNCFNMSLEETRWKSPFRGTIPMADVIAMKKGTLRLGIDVGGGTGSFAAHMARHGVTVMTTAFNVETVSGKKAGLPYMETIAARGLIPLYVPHASRLPLYDGVLDVVHSVNSIKYIPLLQFEELVYEWDRVLRVGGIFWFEMFYAPKEEMPKYVAAIEQVGYKKLYWNFTPKPDAGEVGGEHVYLNCVLEKQPAPGRQVLDGPSAADMAGIV